MEKDSEYLAARKRFGFQYVFVLALLFFFTIAAGIAGAADAGKAGKYPFRPIRIIVPAGAGGSLGNEIRGIAPFLEKSLGVSTVIDYVTGADGIIAYNKIYQEKPDGHTIIYFNLISAITLQLTRETAKYDVMKYVPIAGWNAKYQVLAVHPETWKTFPDFLNEAKKRTLSLAGTGGHTTLNVKVMESALGVKFNLVPYTSAGEGMAAVAGKHVDFLLTYETTPRPMIQAGKLRALAVLSSKPNPILPGVPNLKELGHPEVSIIPAEGNFAAPPGTPKAMADILEKAVSQASANPDLLKIASNIGTYVELIPSAELRKSTLEYFKIVNKYKEFLK
jgi:tripartite-type tricarboxylate transporter receptor subunit TctC